MSIDNVIHSTTFKRTVAALQALATSGVEFAVVADGKKWGNLQVATTKQFGKRDFLMGRRGSLRKLLIEKFDGMSAGELRIIEKPAEVDKPTARFAQSVSAFCHDTWGSGSYMCATNGNSVEVLRIK